MPKAYTLDQANTYLGLSGLHADSIFLVLNTKSLLLCHVGLGGYS